MERNRHIWRYWARNLQRWGLTKWVAALLEAFGPLTVIGAQFIYISQPLLRRSLPGEHLDGLARLLEDSPTTHAFIDYLRETDVQ
jgi:hypothetical protein